MSAPPAALLAERVAAPPAVALRGLVKRFGGALALGGFDLEVAPGTLVGLVGPNGAGKTTTLRIMAGLITPDAGEVRLFGRDPARHGAAVRRQVGWMPDAFGVYDGLTAQEYLDFFAAAFRVPKAERPGRIDELLDLVRLEDHRHTDVHGLSRGMQQRLQLARALVHDPALLLLDEPASGLDPRARVELREILLALVAQGTTVVLSSHILAELAEVCDSVAMVVGGRVVAAGSVADLARAQGTGAVELSIRLADATQAEAAATTAIGTGASVVAVDGAAVHLRLQGGDAEVATLVTRLATTGIGIAELLQRRPGLEQLFLQLTAAPPTGPAPMPVVPGAPSGPHPTPPPPPPPTPPPPPPRATP